MKVPDSKELRAKTERRCGNYQFNYHCRCGLGQRRAGLGCGESWGRAVLKDFWDTWNIEMVVKDGGVFARLVIGAMETGRALQAEGST